jgi:methanogenic corrinoid protein MtbC1
MDGKAQEADQAVLTNTAILKALESFDLEMMQAELEQARLDHGSKDLILKIFLPLMFEVGHLVFNSRMDIAQEHALTALIRSHMLDIFFQTRRLRAFMRKSQSVDRKKTIVVSTPEGDIHEIGILAASVLCADAALNVVYIGPNMPANPLGKVAQMLKADVVMLGLSPLPPGTTPVSTGEYLQELARNLPPSCEIWLGGALPAKVDLAHISQVVNCFKTMGDLVNSLKVPASL